MSNLCEMMGVLIGYTNRMYNIQTHIYYRTSCFICITSCLQAASIRATSCFRASSICAISCLHDASSCATSCLRDASSWASSMRCFSSIRCVSKERWPKEVCTSVIY